MFNTKIGRYLEEYNFTRVVNVRWITLVTLSCVVMPMTSLEQSVSAYEANALPRYVHVHILEVTLSHAL